MNTFSTPLVLLHLISSPHSSFCFFPFNSAWILPYWFQWIKPGWVKSSSSPSLAIDFNNKKNIYFLKKHLSELFQSSLFCFLFFFFFLCFVHFLLQPQFFFFLFRCFSDRLTLFPPQQQQKKWRLGSDHSAPVSLQSTVSSKWQQRQI